MLDKAIKDWKGAPEIVEPKTTMLHVLPDHVCGIMSEEGHLRWTPPPTTPRADKARLEVLQALLLLCATR